MTYPNGGLRLDTPNLTEETDKGTSSGFQLRVRLRLKFASQSGVPLRKSSVLPFQNNLSESQKDQVTPKKTSIKELESNFSLKERENKKEYNISNASLSNAKSEKEKLIKNNQKRTSSKDTNLNQPPEFDDYLFDLAEEACSLCRSRRNS